MPNAMLDEVSEEILDLLDCELDEIIHASGKTGEGVVDIFKAIIDRIPPPTGDTEKPLQAMIFDSMFDKYRGVIAYYRIFNGTLRKNDTIRFVNTGKEFQANELGILRMELTPKPFLSAGNVGYVVTGTKDSKDIKAIIGLGNPGSQ